MQIKEITQGIHTDGVKSGFLATFVDVNSTDNTIKTVDEIIDSCADYGNQRVTLTGDEPLDQKEAPDLTAELLDLNYKVNLETNGTVELKPFEARVVELLTDDEALNNLTYSLAYQCPSTGKSDDMILSNISFLVKGDALKFEINEISDLDYVAEVLEENPTQAEIFVIAKGVSVDEIISYVTANQMQIVRVQKEL